MNAYGIQGMLLDVAAWIIFASVGPQVDDVGIDGKAVLPDEASDVAGHALGHGGCAVGSLEFVVDEGLLSVDLDFEQSVEVAGFDGGLFGGKDFDELDIVALKGELEEVVGGGLDEVFGEGVDGGHGASAGWREGSAYVE